MTAPVSFHAPLNTLSDDALEIVAQYMSAEDLLSLVHTNAYFRIQLSERLRPFFQHKYPRLETQVALRALQALHSDFPEGWAKKTSVSMTRSFCIGDVHGAIKAENIFLCALKLHNEGITKRAPVDITIGAVQSLNLTVILGDEQKVLDLNRNGPLESLEALYNWCYPTTAL